MKCFKVQHYDILFIHQRNYDTAIEMEREGMIGDKKKHLTVDVHVLLVQIQQSTKGEKRNRFCVYTMHVPINVEKL